jgi:membrane-associated phospholipid phosphatase
MMEPVTESIIEPVAEPRVKPVSGPVSGPVAEPASAHRGASGARPPWGSYVIANVVAGLATPLRAPRGAWTKRLVPAWRRYAPYALPIVAVIAGCMAFVDAPMMRAAEALPRGVLDAFNELTDYGRGAWPLVPLFMVLLTTPVLCVPRLGLMGRGAVTAAAIRIGYMFLAIGLAGLADTIIKRLVGRVRPSDFGPFAYEPFSWRSIYASFPSGHATNVFATLVAVGFVFPRLRPALWVYALVIGASRVIVSAHYTSDVMAGAVFGAFGAIVVRDWLAARRLGFYVGRDGRVHAMPGPSWRRLFRVARALLGQ